MKKLLIGIFICLCSVFVMSQNVGAIELTLDFSKYSLSRQLLRPTFDMTFNNDSTTFNNTFQIMPVNANDFVKVQRYKSHSAFNLKAGDLVVMRTLIGSQTANGPYADSMAYIQRNFTTNNGNLVFIGSKTIDVSSDYTIISSLGYGPNANEFYTQLTDYYHSLKVYEFYFRSQIDQTDFIGFESTNYSNNAGMIWVYPSYSSPASLVFTTLSIEQYHPIQTKEEEAAEKEIESSENIENQTPPSQNETGDGQSATNLIGAFSGFVSALGGLSATNCNLTLNFPNFAGGSRVVNVCQNKDKAGNIISVFSSLTLIVFYVPLAIRLLTMIYNEIRSFTNG